MCPRGRVGLCGYIVASHILSSRVIHNHPLIPSHNTHTHTHTHSHTHTPPLIHTHHPLITLALVPIHTYLTKLSHTPISYTLPHMHTNTHTNLSNSPYTTLTPPLTPSHTHPHPFIPSGSWRREKRWSKPRKNNRKARAILLR